MLLLKFLNRKNHYIALFVINNNFKLFNILKSANNILLAENKKLLIKKVYF